MVSVRGALQQQAEGRHRSALSWRKGLHARRHLEISFVSHPSDAMSTAGPPLCPCGLRVVAPLRSLGIRERWAEEEGISWSWVSSSTRGGASVAYFRFCAECHTKTWPDDRRPPNGNRWTRPARRLMPKFKSSLHGRQRLVTGDLYITESPPEYVSAEAQAHVLCMVTKCQGCGFVGGRPHKAK